MRTRFVALGIAVTALLVGLAPTDPIGAGPQTGLDDLAWLAGHWRADDGRSTTEELWTTAAGGVMLGLNRHVGPNERASFEYLRIEAGPEGIRYIASPGGRPATAFKLERAGPRHAGFQNAEHDWPQVIEYRLDASGRLHMRAAGLEAGSHELSWTLQRTTSP